jgi:hypothetical protein
MRMEEEGRQASYNADGEIRGFRSRPGAPTVEPNAFGVANMTSGTGGTPMDAWNKFFNKDSGATAPVAAPINVPPSNISLAPETPPDAAGMASMLSRPYSSPSATPDSLYAQAAKSHEGYLQGVGASPTPTRGVAENIALKYGGTSALADTLRTRASTRARSFGRARMSKLDQSFDSLLEYL